MNAPVAPRHLTPELHEALGRVTLDDKYTLAKGRAYMSGTQALVRLLMLQRERDARDGLNTAGFVSGYRGSPLGGVDQTLWKAKKHLEQNHIAFQPGLNEDLAATSVWGSQQVNMYPKAKYDGVFGMWYGKGPGVDRSGDVFKHANAAGTSKHGGVLVLAGDDHSAKSSTLPHQSDHIFKACGIPTFFPSTVQEYLDLGLHAYAMSRYSGLWVGFKVVTDVVEASASVEVDPDRTRIILPEDFVLPPDGLNIRWPDTPLAQEARLMDYKWYAAMAYVRANKLNHVVWDSPNARFGIMSSGKSYLDTRQALMDLGLGEQECAQLGIRLFKVGVVWPLDAYHVREFATGLEEILVVEEKRQMLEYQLKEELYNYSEKVRPRVFGKFDDREGGEWSIPQGNWLLPAKYELSPAIIAKAIAARLKTFELPADVRARIDARLAVIDAKEKALAKPRVTSERKPFFCSGCPHNTSTRVPEGSRAVAGIGCHYMTVWMPDRRTETFTQMGGEGMPWIGQAPFTDEKHIFANLGDGTYFHSGLLAIRAAVSAKVNITYKILFNDAVAMTGGQATDGSITVPQISRQVAAEGVRKIVVVTDEPEKYDGHWTPNRVIQNQEGSMAIATGKKAKGLGQDHDNHLAPGVSVHHRDELDAIQREFREIEGTTVIIYDQTCASEKRRRRKKIVDGKPLFPDPAKRVFINDLVCEGCGDCSVQSNCLSVEPLETEFGRKRTINQSSCNKDYSCVKGFCPSFVTVEGGRVKKGKGSSAAGSDVDRLFDLPEPVVPEATRPFGVLVMGVGGTGVVTIGQLLGMAGHLEGKGVSVLDMAGLAQKGGEVASHVQIASSPERLQATRIATGEADLVLGCDIIVTANTEAISKMQVGKTRAVVNTADIPTAEFVRNPDWKFPGSDLAGEIRTALGGDRAVADGHLELIDANRLTVALMGDALYTNPFMLGYAWQKGWVPLTRESLERAIELNGVSIDANKKAFNWGRRAAHDRTAVERVAFPAEVVELKRDGSKKLSGSLEEMVSRRAEFLVGYQNTAYAARYTALVDKVRAAEMGVVRDATGAKPDLPLTTAVARYFFKLLAYKDEYEVARLYTDPAFLEKLNAQFEADEKNGPITLKFNLAPPMLAKKNEKGELVKKQYGPWMLKAFGVLAKLKGLRGTAFDPFGGTEERKAERALIAEYESTVAMMIAKLDAANLSAAVAVASVPEEIRGYGHVKEAHMKKAAAKRASLVEAFKAPVQELSRARAA